MKLFFDTSVLVASLVAAHPHHSRAISALRPVIAGDDTGMLAAHSLCEVYAVLTSLPVTPRIGPAAAHQLIEQNLRERLSPVALDADEYLRLVGSLPRAQVSGGATYDALLLAAARKARADRIYTFNLDHFQRLAPDLLGLIAAP